MLFSKHEHIRRLDTTTTRGIETGYGMAAVNSAGREKDASENHSNANSQEHITT